MDAGAAGATRNERKRRASARGQLPGPPRRPTCVHSYVNSAHSLAVARERLEPWPATRRLLRARLEHCVRMLADELGAMDAHASADMRTLWNISGVV